MPGVWLLSTRGRPDACQEVLNACKQTGMTSPGVVYVDETVDDYRKIRLPRNWTIHYEREWGSLGASMTWCFDNYPDATSYGWLADDTVPRTPGWDKRLENAAGDWQLSYARDLWLSEEPFGRGTLEDGMDLSSGLCWGGELVRAAGWWSLPGLTQAGIDTAWTEILSALGLHRYVHDVVVEHKNWRTGKRPRDGGDEWTRAGDPYIARDLETQRRWLASPDFREAIFRIMRAANVTPTQPQLVRLAQQLVDNYANEHWTTDMPAIRLTQIQERFLGELPGMFAEVLGFLPDLRAGGAP